MYGLFLVVLWLTFTPAMAVVLVYSAHRLWCVLAWRHARRGSETAPDGLPWALPLMYGRGGFGAPIVTVQLPMYNEPYVAERAIRAVCAMDWPRDRLQVQVLDDSTDVTSGIIDLCCRELRGEGHEILHLRRPTREGYKAGALQEGMRRARGDLIAVFDADFIPPADFLQRTVAAFCEDRVGMVQAAWSHMNEDQSLLTRAQAMLLDGHFLIESAARHASGRWFNFNGTAGVWRRGAIESAGSWQSDTLTEDVDLSYRAQLKGWRFVFMPDVQCEAELPVRMTDLRTQQWRWTAGSLAAARKLLPTIWRSEEATPERRTEAALHLLGPLVYPALLVLAIVLGPTLWSLRSAWAWGAVGFVLAAALAASASFYLAAAKARGRTLLAAVTHLPVLLMLAVGISAGNAAAAVAGLTGRGGGFRRTPKLRVTDPEPAWRRRARELDRRDAAEAELERQAAAREADEGIAQTTREKLSESIAWPRGFNELALCAWCGAWAAACAVWWPGAWATLLLGLFAAGFIWVSTATLREVGW